MKCNQNPFRLSRVASYGQADIHNLMFVPCIARLRIQNQHCALGYINLFVDMRLLHVSATVCHLQGAS
jgi:hypothetical protein